MKGSLVCSCRSQYASMSLTVGRCNKCSKVRSMYVGEITGWALRKATLLISLLKPNVFDSAGCTAVICRIDGCSGDLLYIGNYEPSNIPRPAYNSSLQLAWPANGYDSHYRPM